SVLLVTWALGGVLFGWVADRIGRKRALFATIALYAAGTGLCALVTNIGQLIACRVIAGLGIGGEWGIGAALVAEAVPEGRRVEAGVIMQTASPLGVVLASAANYQIAGVWFAADPQSSWRYVFLAGLLPVLLAATWQARASNAFNLGGLLGAFAAVPLARGLGRRPMFMAYFLFSALALLLTFGLQLTAQTRLAMLFMVGAGVYGIFGAFTFYLPELFPARLRAGSSTRGPSPRRARLPRPAADRLRRAGSPAARGRARARAARSTVAAAWRRRSAGHSATA